MAATDFVTETQVDSLTTNIATAVKANNTAIAAKTDNTVVNAHISDTTDSHDASSVSVLDTAALYTAADVEAALAEVMNVANAAAGGGVSINDGVTNTTATWSSQKVTDYTAVQVNALVDVAPAALDTLNELAAALGDDPNFAATMTTALALRLRVDAAQAFTTIQKDQGKANLGVISSTVDFASNFNTLIA